MGKVLNEISGISYNPNDSSLLAISDSKKKIFEINLKRLRLRDYSNEIIGPDQDIEDIVNLEDSIYLLSSKGQIYEYIMGKSDSATLKSYMLDASGKNDFESLYYDSASRGIVLLCKSCAVDKGKQLRSAYRFDLETKQFDTTAIFNISTADVKKMMKDDDAKFDPSAAAIHPINKNLYILSSAGNLLVIADNNGKLLSGYNLNPDDHPQAEGIAFAPNGDMYITNEGKYGRPTLQLFKYKGKNKNK
ncbi:MAG: SdiA-regulated domain-containing protein [Flavisolibacter sp.]